MTGSRQLRIPEPDSADVWVPASRRRRAAAWALDLALIVAGVGVGWAVVAWRCWARGTSPGKERLGLVVFGTDTKAPATRARMALRSLVYRMLGRVIGVCTAGTGWLYVVAGAAGPRGSARRTLYDDWAQTVVLVRAPVAAPAASRTQSAAGSSGACLTTPRRARAPLGACGMRRSH